MEPTSAVLTVSFGTAYPETREKTIGAIEKAIANAFPHCRHYRAFTSGMVLRRIAREEKLHFDTVAEAMVRAAAEGVKTLTIQPTLFMPGREYGKILAAMEEHKNLFDRVLLGQPLVGNPDDCRALALALIRDAAAFDDGKTAFCLMGHGTDVDANQVYEALQQELIVQGNRHMYVGTVESIPGIEELLRAVKDGSYRRVVLSPLMVVAGDHACNDMAGSAPDAWASRFRAEGFEVQCILRGLGELEDIQNIYVAHAKAAK